MKVFETVFKRLDMGAAAKVTHITQREAELLGLPDVVDDLVPGSSMNTSAASRALLVLILASLGSSSPIC